MLTQRLSADDEGVARAAALLRAGALVAFPTETVYGLGANAADPGAVARIYAAKGRPSDNPLIVHVASADAVGEWTLADARTRQLAAAFWPGPLTMVLQGRGLFGAPTLALRMPAQPIALALLRAADRPIAAPSANRSGRPSPTTAEAAFDEMDGRIEAVLSGPASAVGIESTVLDLTAPRAAILRPGGISSEAIAQVLGEPIVQARGSARSPGTRYRHYAPDVKVLLIEAADPAAQRERVTRALSAHSGSMYIGLAKTAPQGARGLLAKDLAELQRGLYAALIQAEQAGVAVIAALPPQTSASAGVRDRLVRAGESSLRRGDAAKE